MTTMEDNGEILITSNNEQLDSPTLVIINSHFSDQRITQNSKPQEQCQAERVMFGRVISNSSVSHNYNTATYKFTQKITFVFRNFTHGTKAIS